MSAVGINRVPGSVNSAAPRPPIPQQPSAPLGPSSSLPYSSPWKVSTAQDGSTTNQAPTSETPTTRLAHNFGK